MENYIAYYKKQWFKYFENGMLDYSKITKGQRSNNYIENYNRRIKLKLSKYLYGKSKCKISWPLFLYFIKNEENDVKADNYKLENQIEIKLDDVAILKDKKLKDSGNDLDHIDENETEDIRFEDRKADTQYNRNWLKFNNYSCRHDSFFLLLYISGNKPHHILSPHIFEFQNKSPFSQFRPLGKKFI